MAIEANISANKINDNKNINSIYIALISWTQGAFLCNKKGKIIYKSQAWNKKNLQIYLQSTYYRA